MFVLIAYDISNDKRLRKVARAMQSFGVRVQRSVFECRINPAQLDALIARVKLVIKPREDRIHLYQICETCQERMAKHGRAELLTDPETWVW